MAKTTQTHCNICDRDDVSTWAGVCADCWRQILEPGAPNADLTMREEG